MMNKTQAQGSIKRLNAELFSLNPSALLTFFTIDLSQLMFDKGFGPTVESNEQSRIFRFHNNVFLTRETLVWRGDTYQAIPLEAEGFELSSQGALPTPKLRLSVSDEGAPVLGLLKSQIRLLGDAAGVKVTRQRTLAKYVDASNFGDEDAPPDHSEDLNAEFPKDIFFVERVTQENKNVIEYQLNSALDLENVRLPARMMIQQRCMWFYRGEGCSYEFSGGLNEKETEVHGSATLPPSAPPISTLDDKLFKELLPGVSLQNKGDHSTTNAYSKGDYVFIRKDGHRYYFVCVSNAPYGTAITSTFHWVADQCSKSVRGCKNRWQRSEPNLRTALPFGGFPALGRIK
jgi:lambda family phage minor tail protein L